MDFIDVSNKNKVTVLRKSRLRKMSNEALGLFPYPVNLDHTKLFLKWAMVGTFESFLLYFLSLGSFHLSYSSHTQGTIILISR